MCIGESWNANPEPSITQKGEIMKRIENYPNYGFKWKCCEGVETIADECKQVG